MAAFVRTAKSVLAGQVVSVPWEAVETGDGKAPKPRQSDGELFATKSETQLEVSHASFCESGQVR